MNLERKNIVKGVIPILLLIILALWLYSQYTSKSFEELLGTKADKITRILMRSGDNGFYVNTTDLQKIEEFLQLVQEKGYKKSFDQRTRGGYSYYYDFYHNEEKLMRMCGHGDYIQINTTYYDVSEEILLEDLRSWFQSLPVNRN